MPNTSYGSRPETAAEQNARIKRGHASIRATNKSFTTKYVGIVSVVSGGSVG